MNRSARPAKSHRLLRVGELIRHALSDILTRGDLREPALDGVPVTVTEVKVSPDLHNATVFVMPLGGAHAHEVLAGLERSAGYLRGQISKNVILRYIPKLNFELDQTFDAADRIESLLRDPKVARDLAHDHGPRNENDNRPESGDDNQH